MEEYYRFQNQLLVVTVAISAFICMGVCLKFSLPTALSYGIGACAGLIYLGMLARNVAQIGIESRDSSGGRLALVAVIFLVSLKLDQIEFLPVFFGFLTHKLALVGHTFWDAFLRD
ncbi:MAG: ATP synthase subunit I [Leptolyngbya sp. RL_3_1]|nr:ATP synthase subunit I [Leptolyngbya sp. RL_3_1]